MENDWQDHVKNVRKKCSYRSFSGPYFPGFGLNTLFTQYVSFEIWE